MSRRPLALARGAVTVALLLLSTSLPSPAGAGSAGSHAERADPERRQAPASSGFAAAYEAPVPVSFSWIDLSGIVLDLRIEGIEITQAIQCYDSANGDTTCADNSLSLVADKPAAARIYVDLNTSSLSSLRNVPVRLHIGSTAVDLTGTAPLNPTQADLDDSVNAYFETSGTVEFYAEVDPDDEIPELLETNNRFPAEGTITMTFASREAPLVEGFRLYYHPSGYTGTRIPSGWAVDGGGAEWLEAVWPVQEIDYDLASGVVVWTTDLTDSDEQHELIEELNATWLLEVLVSILLFGLLPIPDHVYGWIPSDAGVGGHADMPVYPHAGGLGVVGIGTETAGTSTDSPGAGALVFGHELTHDHDVYHTNTSDSCGSSDSNSDWPYSFSSIEEYGFNPVTEKIYDPNTTHDLMSYCPAAGSKEGWVSPFTWDKMFDEFTPRSSSAPAAPGLALTDGSRTLMVQATLREGGGSLGTLRLLDVAAEFNPLADPGGPYAIELREADQVLSREPFDVSFLAEDGESVLPSVGVSLALPWAAGTTSVALMRGQQELDEVVVSAARPRVTITEPSTAEEWKPGSAHTLSWNASDPDGDELTFDVFYSGDGMDWELLRSGLRKTSLRVTTNSLAGGSDTAFVVLASDGVRTGRDRTDEQIMVPNKAPVATILNPRPGHRVPVKDLVVLQGRGMDLEDGAIPRWRLVWSSDRQGRLGTGPVLPLNTLDRGAHVITLKATDGDGRSDTASVELYVTRVGKPVVSPEPSPAGQKARARATFTDPGQAKRYRCTVDYGDGSAPVAGEVVEDECVGPVHTYGDPGTYTVVISMFTGGVRIGTGFAGHTVAQSRY